MHYQYNFKKERKWKALPLRLESRLKNWVSILVRKAERSRLKHLCLLTWQYRLGKIRGSQCMSVQSLPRFYFIFTIFNEYFLKHTRYVILRNQKDNPCKVVRGLLELNISLSQCEMSYSNEKSILWQNQDTEF